MDNISAVKCTPCDIGASKITDEDFENYRPQIPNWNIIEENGIKKIRREFKFKNFAEALKFTNCIGKLAEDMQHHPAILTEWGKVEVTWWTHKIKGLNSNDLIMALKTDILLKTL